MNSWTEDTSLNAERWGHTIQYIPDARVGSDGSEIPVIFGGNVADCEVYDTAQGIWSDYNFDLPDVS